MAWQSGNVAVQLDSLRVVGMLFAVVALVGYSPSVEHLIRPTEVVSQQHLPVLLGCKQNEVSIGVLVPYPKVDGAWRDKVARRWEDNWLIRIGVVEALDTETVHPVIKTLKRGRCIVAATNFRTGYSGGGPTTTTAVWAGG